MPVRKSRAHPDTTRTPLDFYGRVNLNYVFALKSLVRFGLLEALWETIIFGHRINNVKWETQVTIYIYSIL